MVVCRTRKQVVKDTDVHFFACYGRPPYVHCSDGSSDSVAPFVSEAVEQFVDVPVPPVVWKSSWLVLHGCVRNAFNNVDSQPQFID